MKFTSSPLRYYAVLIGLYLSLVVFLPANKVAMMQYHLTPTQHQMLLLAVVLPFIGIWFAAFYSYDKLARYAKALADTDDGANYTKLAVGCTWLAWALPVPAIIAIILNSIANSHPSFHTAAIVITNYLNLIMPLIAFTLIGSAARGLSTSHGVHLSLNTSRLLIALFALLGVIYCFLTFRHFDMTSLTTSNNPYFLPIWLMLVSIIIPYLYSWYVGLLAGFEMIAYAYKARGVFYRSALRYLGFGILAVIASSIALQYLNSVVPRTGYLALNMVLALNYGIRLLVAAGYICIAVGASRLRKIEEV